MNDGPRDILERVAQVAFDLGPALTPIGHIELLRSVTDAAKELFQAAACSVALLTDDQKELVFHVASGAGREDVEGMRMPSSQGIAGWVVTSGQPMAIEDTTNDPRFARERRRRDRLVEVDPRDAAGDRATDDRRDIGARRQGHPSGTGKEMELLSIFARQAALAIENSRVFTDLGRALFDAVGARPTTPTSLDC